MQAATSPRRPGFLFCALLGVLLLLPAANTLAQAVDLGAVLAAPRAMDLVPVEAVPYLNALQPAGCVVPAKPTLSRSPSSVAVGGQVTLSWSPDPFITATYIPYAATSSGGPWSPLVGTPMTGTSINVNMNVTAGTYYFFIRAIGTCDLYVDSNVVSVSVTGSGGGGGGGCVGPPTPTLSVNSANVTVGQTFTLSWSADPYGTTEYWWLGVNSAASGTFQVVSTYSGGTTSASITATSANAGQTLYFRVWAYPYGGSTCEGLRTNSNAVAVSVTTGGGGGGGCVGPPTPTLSVNSANVTVGQTFTLSWSADPYGTTDHWWLGVNSAPTGTYQLVSTYSPGTTSASITATTANAGQTLYFRVWAYPFGGSTCEGLKTNSNAVSVAVTSGGGGGGGACTPDATSLCLFGNRFRVQATYRDYGGNTGSGKAVSLTSDSGYFWFFTSSNVEIVAKLVSFCNGSSGNYGVYLSGLTDVQVSFTVTDTKTGTTRSYNNPLGSRFCTIGDPWTVCP